MICIKMSGSYRLPEPGGLPEPHRLPERMPAFLQAPSQDWSQILNKRFPLPPPPLPHHDSFPAPTYFAPRAPSPSTHSSFPVFPIHLPRGNASSDGESDDAPPRKPSFSEYIEQVQRSNKTFACGDD